MMGVPSAIISPDGLRTKPTIDEYNQLKERTYPNGKSFTFGYLNNDSLLTAKTEPNGNLFEHFFDDTGRVDKTTNQEQGVWQFAQQAVAEGLVTSTTVKRLTKSTGVVDSTSIE